MIRLSTVQKDGIAAAITSAVFSGVPSSYFIFSKVSSADEGVKEVLTSIRAIGNFFVQDITNIPLLYAGGVALHLILSFFYSQILAEILKDKSSWNENVVTCFLASFIIHTLDLVIIPNIYTMPLLNELLDHTGLLPHLCDHIAFGTTIGITLAIRKYIRINQVRDKSV